MPVSCCAVGCTNRCSGATAHLSYYKMPIGKSLIEQRRREEWIKALRRDDWKTWSYDQISFSSTFIMTSLYIILYYGLHCYQLKAKLTLSPFRALIFVFLRGESSEKKIKIKKKKI